ncbi:hypothetical protein QUB70_33180 [Microcoleus sp. A003_D6]
MSIGSALLVNILATRRKKEEGRRKKEEYRSSKLWGDLDVKFN